MNEACRYSELLHFFHHGTDDVRWLRSADSSEDLAIAMYVVKRDTDGVTA